MYNAVKFYVSFCEISMKNTIKQTKLLPFCFGVI